MARPVRWLPTLGLAALGVAIVVAVGVLRTTPVPEEPPPPRPPTPASAAADGDLHRRITPQQAAEFAAIEAREQAATESVWAVETLADSAGRVFEHAWDSINAATNKLEAATQIPFHELRLPSWLLPRPQSYGIDEYLPAEPFRNLDSESWTRLVRDHAAAGWRLLQCEFRHVAFDPATPTAPARSRFRFTAHLTHAVDSARAEIAGPLLVEWQPTASPAAPWTPASLDARQLTLRLRHQPVPWKTVLEERLEPIRNSLSIDPLVVHDLDDDGRPEILLPARNVRYSPDSNGTFRGTPLFSHSPGPLYTALLADADGDGFPDFLVQKYEGLLLIKGSPHGRFEAPAQLVWPRPPEVDYPMVLTAGDIDNDGDLDLYLAQYRDPYEDGALPSPFYSANNGHPAFLLRNDGAGRFTDITESAGLGPLRRRRTYSASFLDLDGDHAPELVTVSDFAGVDIFRNLGAGRFAGATPSFVSEPHAFGMAHGFSDFDADGRLDLLMTGMGSPTVERLDHLGLVRPGLAGEPEYRRRMAHGNRLYLGQPDGTLREAELSASIANSGWSWGCGIADFDNDGFPDVYIANGLESRESVRDYEPEYWLHDRYVGTADDNPAALLYFKAKIARTRGRGESYGGYEKNRLYFNRGGQSFLEVGHLLGLALEEDSRNVVAADFDADGKPDLAVISYEGWPRLRHVLRVYRNALPESPPWIRFRLADSPGKDAVIGARVELRAGNHRAVRVIVTGDSYRSQHPPVAHFGLGGWDALDSATITWPDGTTRVLERPEPNREHRVQR